MERTALQTANLKNRGHVLQLGLLEEIEALNRIAAFTAETVRENTVVFDEFKGRAQNLLEGLDMGTHYAAPPTLHAFARIYREMPILRDPILLLHIAQDDLSPLEPNFDRLQRGTVVLGDMRRLHELVMLTKLTVRPLYYLSHKIVFEVRGRETNGNHR